MKRENFLMILKQNQKYYFKYKRGEEKQLFFVLIEYGKDDSYNITLIEVLHLIRKISQELREKGYKMNKTFHITPEEERDK